jgi:hypothetical protein
MFFLSSFYLNRDRSERWLTGWVLTGPYQEYLWRTAGQAATDSARRRRGFLTDRASIPPSRRTAALENANLMTRNVSDGRGDRWVKRREQAQLAALESGCRVAKESGCRVLQASEQRALQASG